MSFLYKLIFVVIVKLALPFGVVEANSFDDRDVEVLGGGEGRIVEGSAVLRPPVVKVLVDVDSSPLPNNEHRIEQNRIE